MNYKVETSVPLTFENGKVLMPLAGQVIDLMKLDTVAEFREVLKAVAQSTIGAIATAPAAETPQQPVTGPDFSAAAEKLRQQFQELSDRADQKLAQYAQTVPNENPTSTS
jgi:hypothetical protein